MAKRSAKRRTDNSQRMMQILGGILVLSMVLVLLAPLAGGSSRRTATPEPLPTSTPMPQPTPTELPTATPRANLAPTPDTGG